MRYSKRQRLQYVIISLLLALVFSGLAVWTNSEAQSKAPLPAGNATRIDNFSPSTRVMLFSSSAGQWVLARFAQAKPDNEFYFNNQLCRVVDSNKAQVVLNVDAGKLFEAGRQYDTTSRRPGASDVVQVLDTDIQFLAHTLLGEVQPGAIVRFQGRAYNVKADLNLVNTGMVFSSATSNLQRIEITTSGLQHVIDRHTVDGTKNAGKSIFNSGEDIQALIRCAQLTTPVPQAGGNYQRAFDAGRTIGTDRATSKLTSTYTVITTQSGKLVTAFPGRP